jgi:hypothetical protein
MVNSQQLQKQTSELLNKDVIAVGIFEASVNFFQRAFAPAAPGLAFYAGAKLLQKKAGQKVNGASVAAVVAAGALGAIGTQKALNIL